jgi:hypothetical protein
VCSRLESATTLQCPHLTGDAYERPRLAVLGDLAPRQAAIRLLLFTAPCAWLSGPESAAPLAHGRAVSDIAFVTSAGDQKVQRVAPPGSLVATA